MKEHHRRVPERLSGFADVRAESPLLVGARNAKMTQKKGWGERQTGNSSTEVTVVLWGAFMGSPRGHGPWGKRVTVKGVPMSIWIFRWTTKLQISVEESS